MRIEQKNHLHLNRYESVILMILMIDSIKINE
jgi:hypothetical protein